MANLTKRAIDAAKSGATLWDDSLKGFGLRVSAGGSKTFVIKYRRGKVQRWVSIGRYGAPWTPDEARREAKRLFGLIESGKDPAHERRIEREAESFEAFAARYLRDHSDAHKKPSTAREERRGLRKYILPMLGQLSVMAIEKGDIVRWHRSMSATPYAANRFLNLLSHMFNTAEAWGLRPDNSNPCRRIQKYPEKSRERFLSPDELSRLGRALSDAASGDESIYVVGALRLLILTGARLSEILTLRWEHVDFESRLLRLPDSKTGKKTIALPAPALDILASLPKQEGNSFVICGAMTGAHLVNLQKPWRRIRKDAGLDDVRIHDLRHSFASVAVAGGASLPLIGALLGHTQPQTTARYAHLGSDPRLAAADAVANRIVAAMRGESADVIGLSTAQKRP